MNCKQEDDDEPPFRIPTLWEVCDLPLKIALFAAATLIVVMSIMFGFYFWQ